MRDAEGLSDPSGEFSSARALPLPFRDFPGLDFLLDLLRRSLVPSSCVSCFGPRPSGKRGVVAVSVFAHEGMPRGRQGAAGAAVVDRGGDEAGMVAELDVAARLLDGPGSTPESDLGKV